MKINWWFDVTNKIKEMKYAYLCSFFRLNRLSPNIATMMVRVPDVMRNTGTTKNSCKKNMNEIVMSCHTMVPICMGESKNAKPKQTVLMLHHKRKNFELVTEAM